MILTENDVAVLGRFEFSVQPVGVKFLVKQPENMERLTEKVALCEMVVKAQQGNVFYAGREDHSCDAGTYVLGQTDAPEPFISGQFGAGLQIFESPRSASRLYAYIPRIKKNQVNFVAFAPLDRLSFDPDLLIILARTAQSEILMRAMSYKSGEMWSSRMSAAIGCAWLFVYPYLSGKLNYTTCGFGHGMKRRDLFPEGHQLLSIPFDILPSVLQNLQEMPWVLPAYKPDGMEFVRKVLVEIGAIPG